MKIVLLSLLGMLLFASCGDSKKSMCDCMELALKNPSLDDAPKGCEWIDKVSDEEGEKMALEAMKDCPDAMAEAMGMAMGEEDETEVDYEDENDEDMSFCDCMILALDNPSADETPIGCEWMDDISEEEAGRMMIESMSECPDIMSKVAELGMAMEDEMEN